MVIVKYILECDYFSKEKLLKYYDLVIDHAFPLVDYYTNFEVRSKNSKISTLCGSIYTAIHPGRFPAWLICRATSFNTRHNGIIPFDEPFTLRIYEFFERILLIHNPIPPAPAEILAQ